MTDSQRGKIFCLAKDRGLDNELLHEFVFSITGKDSLKDLSKREVGIVIDGLVDETALDGVVSVKQKKYIEGLAAKIGWDDGKLENFILKHCNISHIRWLTSKGAAEVIQALKAICERNEKAV